MTHELDRKETYKFFATSCWRVGEVKMSCGGWWKVVEYGEKRSLEKQESFRGLIYPSIYPSASNYWLFLPFNLNKKWTEKYLCLSQ